VSEFSIPELELAFGYHIVRVMIGLDESFDLTEVDYLERVFPRTALEVAGYVDDAGEFTERHREAMRAALQVLPSRPLNDRLHFLTVFLGAAYADGEFHDEERSLLFQAAGMLGIGEDDVKRHLDASIWGR